MNSFHQEEAMQNTVQADAIVRALLDIGHVTEKETSSPVFDRSEAGPQAMYHYPSHIYQEADRFQPLVRGPYRCRRCGQIKRHHTCRLAQHQRSVHTQTIPSTNTHQGFRMIAVTPRKRPSPILIVSNPDTSPQFPLGPTPYEAAAEKTLLRCTPNNSYPITNYISPLPEPLPDESNLHPICQQLPLPKRPRLTII